MDTSHIQPTLTDTEVLEFCKNGYLLLDGVVPEEINHKAVAFLDSDTYYEPTDILAEDWFIENVTLNPAAAGAIRSLLGAGFTAPVLMSNHRVHMPQPAQHWHRDGQSRYGPALHYLQVFYYPEACTPEMGPTEVLPGSHYLFQHASFMGHYGNMRHSVKTAASAGSIVLTVYSVWHRRSASSASGIRNLLKYNYWRTSPPVRDWTIEAGLRFCSGRLHGRRPGAAAAIPGMPGRRRDVLLALRQVRRIPDHGRPGLALAGQPQRTARGLSRTADRRDLLRLAGPGCR